MSHVPADFAFYPESLFLCSFRELSLKRIFLSTITSFLSIVCSFTFSQGTTLPSLVQGDSVNLMSFAVRTVRPDFFGNIHGMSTSFPLKKHTHSYTFSASQERKFQWDKDIFLWNFCDDETFHFATRRKGRKRKLYPAQ